MIFEYDPLKAILNANKHNGIDFSEAASVFYSPLTVFQDDPEHSFDEDREIAIGFSSKGKLLFVSFVERTRPSDSEQTIRLISARLATHKERRDYDKTR